jgi:formylglycine-generating enzyme required for sulfatase activity
MSFPTKLSIDASQINLISERKAMGLPEHYVPGVIESELPAFEYVRRLTITELVSITENPKVPFKTRYAAGTMLALVGDPRIQVFEPRMILITGGQAKIGLSWARVSEVAEMYRDLGVIRPWIEKEAPQFETTVQSFKIAKYPVTNVEYLAFLKDTQHPHLPTSWQFGCFPLTRANHPVYTVSPESADAYAQWLSEKTNRQFRLPSEIEWEYAAGGPEGLEFPWGEKYLDDRANTVESGILSTTSVGIYPKGNSIFGVSDLAGNIEEYVSDDYWAYPGSQKIEDDLMQTIGSSYRVARGGSFTRFRDLARCKRRHGWFPKDIYVMGFRLAETI